MTPMSWRINGHKGLVNEHTVDANQNRLHHIYIGLEDETKENLKI
jgi:hypothetical protein